ncbi:MAG: DUF6585 family protein [Gemmataceae bacterium]
MRDDAPVSVHVAGPLGFFRSQMGPMLLAGCAVGLMLIALFVKSKEGPEVNRWIAIGSAGAIVAAIIWGGAAYAGLVKKVTIFPDRVEWAGQIASWKDIKDVWRTEIIVNGNMQTRQVVIKTRDGVEATFLYILSDWAKMANTIQVETAKVIGPKAFADYEAGKPVKFGNVVVSQSGLKIGGKSIPWTLVVRTTVENGYYNVYQPGEEWCTVSASLGETPNMLVLLHLLDRTPSPPFSGPNLRKRG